MNDFFWLILGLIGKVSEFFTSVYCSLVGHKWISFINKQVICSRCGKTKEKT